MPVAINISYIAIYNCLECEYECLDGIYCVPYLYVCDGVNDCVDGSDELYCISGDCCGLVLNDALYVLKWFVHI